MTLSKLEEVHWGQLVLTVFRSTLTEKTFLSLDRIEAERRVPGPLISERDFTGMASLMRRRGQPSSLPTAAVAAEPPQSQEQPPCTSMSEIENAIREARQPKPVRASITVIPTMPPWRYLHTCSACGCHVQATLRLGGTDLHLCAGCRHVDSIYVNGIREA